MAAIYGRLTGNPEGCLGKLGPGATNLITGVADSNMDRSPILVIPIDYRENALLTKKLGEITTSICLAAT